MRSKPPEQPRKATGEMDEWARKTAGKIADAIHRADGLSHYGAVCAAQEILGRCLSVFPAAAQGLQTVPVAWLHEVKEPDSDWRSMLSRHAEHPWSHWIERHKAECEFKSTPLYAAPALLHRSTSPC